MPAALQIRGLTKRFGDKTALSGVDLTVEEGSVYGFLGPNGAGKTTALRIITGLARADAGKVSILGNAPGSTKARSLTGFLPDVPGFYEWMDAEEFLRFAGGLHGIEASVLAERVPLLLNLAGLSAVTSRVGGFSRGMKQRLGVAQALVNAPRLLLLDEPTSALDPLGRKEVLDMIASLKGRTTVFFSTHLLADVERVCDSVAILDRGRMIAESPIDLLKERHSSHKVIIEVAEGATSLAEQIAGRPWASGVSRDGETLTVTVGDADAAGREVPELVSARQMSLVRFEHAEVSLEDVFVELVKGAAQ